MSTEEEPRPVLLADTALRLIAEHGLRGLTHRAVDAAAGLPQGSTSYYFRNRHALVAAAVERLVALDLAELGATPLAERSLSFDELVQLGVEWLRAYEHREAWRQLARYELLLEGRRRPEVQSLLHNASDRLRERFTDIMERQSVDHPALRASWFVAAVDGLILDALLGPVAVHPRTDAELRLVAADLVHGVYRSTMTKVSPQVGPVTPMPTHIDSRQAPPQR